MRMTPNKQKGTALVFALIFLLILSIMAASLMFLAQSETWGSTNYRLMTQGRYGAEAAINQTANYLMFTYAPPGGPGDPLANYDTTKSPVTLAGTTTPVVLSTQAGNSAYPSGAVAGDFVAKVPGTLTAGYGSVSYAASAKLLSMEQVNVAGAGAVTTAIVQMWEITGDGNINSVSKAQVEVKAILERQKTQLFKYAAFATNNGCGALDFSGGATTNSYDASALGAGGLPVISNSYGNVGSNGNLNESGSGTIIYGSMSTPRTGVGKCAAGGVDAWTDNGNAQVTGGMKLLPQPVTIPTPVIPPPGTTNISGTQTLAPGNYGDINLSGQQVLTLTPGVYNINTISEQGQSVVNIGPIPGSNPPQYGPVVLNVTGNGKSTVVQLTGGGVTNPTYDSSMLQIYYAGSGTISLKGGAQSSAVVDAPNAAVSFNSSGGHWYGAVIGQSVKDAGGMTLSYDRSLEKKLFYLSNYMLDSFSWSKY